MATEEGTTLEVDVAATVHIAMKAARLLREAHGDNVVSLESLVMVTALAELRGAVDDLRVSLRQDIEHAEETLGDR